jgi:hypothetical protein
MPNRWWLQYQLGSTSGEEDMLFEVGFDTYDEGVDAFNDFYTL